MTDRLSSDNLFHFTKEAETIIKICQSGFRYSHCEETIPHGRFTRSLFNISFCDIQFKDSQPHRNYYGNNAIVLKKEWGIEKGISPVLYVHKNSPGLTEEYALLKQNYHFLRGLAINYPNKYEFDLLYLFTSLMEIEIPLKDLDVEKETRENIVKFKNLYDKFDQDFRHWYDSLIKLDKELALTFTKYLNTLIFRITELHNELTERDNYTRIYQEKVQKDNLTHQSRIFYDEKEWRSIRLEEVDTKNGGLQIEEVRKNLKQGYLPSSCNLLFTEKDVVGIIVEDNFAKDVFIKCLDWKETLISEAFIRRNLYTIEEFNDEENQT